MKKVIGIEPISEFTYRVDGKERTEIEHYSDGTKATVFAFYQLKR